MKTIQMSIDESLLAEIDRVAQELKTNRYAFMSDAIRLALQRVAMGRIEVAHARGYERTPQTPDEAAEWEEEQVWGCQ